MLGIQRSFREWGSLPPMQGFLKNCVFYFDKNLSNVTDTGTLTCPSLAGVPTNLQQSISGNKPTFSTSNGFTFDNSNDYLEFSTKPSFYLYNHTIYFRWNRTSQEDDTLLLGYDGDQEDGFWVLMRGTSLLYGATSFTGLTWTDILGDNLYKITTNGTTASLYANGVLLKTATINSSYGGYVTLERIGYKTGKQAMQGNLSQLAIYNKILTADEMTAVENQLTNKNVITNYARQYVDSVEFYGQSNCDGRAHLSSFSSALQNFTNGKIAGTTDHKWYDINAQNLNAGGFADYKSFEMELAYRYYQSKNKNLYVFKFGLGSTFLADKASGYHWNSRSVLGSTGTRLYNFNCKYRYTFFNQYLLSIGVVATNKAFIWMQGEQDATVEADANAYQANILNIIDDVRTVRGNSNLPIIITRINGANDSSEVYRLTVRAAQLYASQNRSYVYMIDTDSYPLGDTVHYNATGYTTGGDDIYNLCVAQGIF